MPRDRPELNALGFLGALLDRRDWVYSLSLLVPFAIYNLALKALEITSLPGEHELAQTLDLMSSAIFFNLGYALLWIGLFAAVRSSKGPLRRAVVFLFHAATMLVAFVTTCAYQYFQETGATLKYDAIAESIPRFDEIAPILLQRVPLSVWILLAIVVFYAALGPLLLTRAVERWRGWSESPRTGKLEVFSFSLALGLCFLALGFGSLSLDAGATSSRRDSFVNVIVPGAEENNSNGAPSVEGVEEAEEDNSNSTPGVEQPAAHAALAQTPQTEKRNVVLVHLESTRARSVTPYNEDLNTTPFLDELSKESSLLVEQAHVGSIPRSLMSSISVNCGIQPPPRLGEESDPTGVPVPCLASLLKDQGYSTAFFSSNADEYVKYATSSWGYQEAFAPPGPGVPDQFQDRIMDTQKYAHTSDYGYEEGIMLEPSENWLEGHKDEPIMAEYLMNTGHDNYQCLNTSYGSEDFSNDDLLNHYLNCMRLQDIFLQNLIDQYKELGLYDNTIFVLFGDHGEGMGEHGRFMHGDTIWEEGLSVPLIIHAPGMFEDGERAKSLSNFTDILPTVLDMLGYDVRDGEYPGYSLLHPLPEDRTLMFSCISRRECLASIKGNEKYIYHYDNQPEELFDLSKDPLEEHNLADEYSEEDLQKRRKDIFAWILRIDAQYYGYESPLGNGQEDTEQQAGQSRGQPAGSTVEVGEPLTVGNVEWTVTSAHPADKLISSVDGGTKRGNFVVVDFQLKNNSNEGLNLNSKSLALLDGDGRKLEFDTDTYLYIDRAKNLFRVEVYPGASQEGEVIFEVPPDTSQLQLQLGEATNPFSNESGYVNLGL
ncbi:MAG: sulfatase-like hydrolase/transferase [Actinobacteria bacterium]|nr:sulfatase-like hydrolase/transferase [Actinomycetota bacterium]